MVFRDVLLCVSFVGAVAERSAVLESPLSGDGFVQLKHRYTPEDYQQENYTQEYDVGELEQLDSRCADIRGLAPEYMQSVMPNICRLHVTPLTNADFREGSYIIKTPGIYRLVEDIFMEPSGPEVDARMMPVKTSTKYPLQAGYWLGFFAAIVIDSHDVFIDLNDYTIAQSQKFQRAQRFFQVIQLGSKPFKAKVGPPQFKKLEEPLRPANNVWIVGGTIGTSGHIGIHGTSVENLWVHDTRIKDFEVGGIQINGCRYCYVTDTTIGPSDHTTPGYATLSQAINLLRMVSTSQPESIIEEPEFAALDQVVSKYLDGTCGGECSLFTLIPEDDGSTLPDGSSMYGMMFHAAALPIHDFLTCSDLEAIGESFGPVLVQNVTIQDLRLRTDEVEHFMVDGQKPLLGPAGDVIQINRLRDGEQYSGSVLSQAQLKLGKLKAESDLPAEQLFEYFGSTNVPDELLKWQSGAITYTEMEASLHGTYRCNKDSMNHHNKGIMGIRVTSTDEITLRDVTIHGLENVGNRVSILQDVDHCQTPYSGNDVRGIVAARSHIVAENVHVSNLATPRGRIWGVDLRKEATMDGSPQVDGVDAMLQSDADIAEW